MTRHWAREVCTREQTHCSAGRNIADGRKEHPQSSGKALAGGAQGGLVVSIALGFIGALLGPWVARQLNLAEPFVLHVSGQTFPIVWLIIGAAPFVALLHLVSGRRWART